jgi:glutaredoxin 3
MSTQPKIVIYGDESCAYCAAARMLFTKKGLRFDDVMVFGDEKRHAEMEQLTGSRLVPQILINDHIIGGFDELSALDKDGDLERLLEV